jgi:hypothetical protein
MTHLEDDVRAILADPRERVILAERRLEAERANAISAAEREARTSQDRYAYASDSGACYRKVGFRVLEFERAPMDLEGELTVAGGRDLEELVCMALDRRHKDSMPIEHAHLMRSTADTDAGIAREITEMQVRFAKGNIHGRADYVYMDAAAKTVVCEIKATASYGMKLAYRDGPKPEHLTQAMVGADALGASAVRLIYICRGRGDKGVPLVLDWTEPLDPELIRLAHKDADAIVGTLNEGYLPPRLYDGELIEDPASERWPCGWCAYAGVCQELPTDGVLLVGAEANMPVVQLQEGGA